MASGQTDQRRPHRQTIGIAGGLTGAVLTAVVTALGAGAGSASPTTDEPATTTAEAADTTTSVAAASSDEFTAMLDTACEGDSGHPLLAAALLEAAATDGSLRVIEIVQRCDVEFTGAVDADIGRPRTNVEGLIADPVNNVTPNQAQLDLLNAELSIYWRIAETWAQSQAPAAPETSAPATDTAPPATEETPATTGG
jgi:hypothetical protein